MTQLTSDGKTGIIAFNMSFRHLVQWSFVGPLLTESQESF